MNCSFAKHFLKVFGYREYTRDPSESTELFNIRRILNEDERYKDVRDVLEGMSLKSVMARRTAEQEDWPSVEGLIKRAMQQIALAADIMISTTHVSLERLTKFFNKIIAKLTVIDEAGCVRVIETMIPCSRSRPLLLAGDINQLPPAVMSKNKRTTVGNKLVPANIFSNHHSVSFLQKIMVHGWPCLVLNEQLRICSGGFDLASETIYKDQQVFYTAGTALSSQRYRYAAGIDNALQNLDSSIACSPPGKLWPVFLHCDNSQCVKTENSSRYKAQQADKATNLIRVIGREFQASPNDMLIIVPYHAMLSHVRSRLLQVVGNLQKVPVATADSFQGHEVPLVFFILTVTAESGPGFLCDRRRLNVSSTRQSEMLFVIGDINTVKSANASVPIQS
jgi:superfamily I DNA and/or RNA helicase